MPTYRIALAVLCCLMLPASLAFAEDDKSDEFDPTQFGWSTTPAQIQAKLETPLKKQHFGTYKRLSRTLELHSENWRQFFIFKGDKLIAQGYERGESLEKPRVGTMSDVVSYNNNYWVVKYLERKHGEPEYVDSRTRKEYSQELGDDALLINRSLEWDLLGERFRWELKDGTIRYSVQYSMNGHASHRVVNVNPGSWANYFEFQTAQAFRDAGINLIRRFHKRTNKWVVATVSPSGKLTVKKYNPPSSAKPRSAKRTEWSTGNCNVGGQECTITYKYYGGHLYQIDLDFSKSAKFPRRAHHEELGKAYYKHFAKIDNRLRRHLGAPGDTQVLEDPDNRRELLKVENLMRGQEGFWSIWFDVGNDVLVRHHITGENHGDRYTINHKVTFRFHNVARAMAEQDAWKLETAKMAGSK